MVQKTVGFEGQDVLSEKLRVDVQPSPDVKPEFFLVIGPGRLRRKTQSTRARLENLSLALYYWRDDERLIFMWFGFSFSFVPAEGNEPGFWAFTEESHDKLYGLITLVRPIGRWTKEALVRWWYGGELKSGEVSAGSDRFYLYFYLLNVIESVLTKAVPPE